MQYHTLSAHKKILRTYMRNLRCSLTLSERYIAAQLITNKIISLNDTHKSKHIALFMSIDGEIDTNFLIKTLLFMNKNIYLPIIPSTTQSQFLRFAQYTLSTPLIQTRWNIYEPKYNNNSIISVDMLDLIFIPLVAFDKQRNRLGMGSGFYDKTLQHHNTKNHIHLNCIGLGYDFQLIPTEFLPVEKQDVQLSTIITPSFYFVKK